MNPHDKYFEAQKVTLAARSIPTVKRSGRRFSFVSFVMGMAFGAAVALGLEGALHQECAAVASDAAAAIGNEHWQLYQALGDGGPPWKL